MRLNTTKTKDLLKGVVLAALFVLSGVANAALTLAWDPSSGATGYKLYYGTSSSNYTAVVDARNNTSNRITTLQVGTTYFFAVSAYNASTESAPSGEISYTITNAAPTISAIANQSINKNLSTGPIAFTVQDAETAANSLIVQASSGNTALLPNNRITLGGSGANRTITLTPAANQSGSATISITADDGATITTRSFLLTVTGLNNAPTVTAPASLTLAKETSVPVSGIAMSDADVNTANYTLTLQANFGRIQVATGLAGGVTLAQVVSNGSGNVRITAPLAIINATLAAASGVSLVGGLNFVGSDALTVTINDNGNSGTGGAKTAAAQVPVSVTGNAQDSWRMLLFSYADLSDPAKEATVWGDKADPDGDGLDNLFEYAVGLNPTNREASDAAVSSSILDASGTKYSALTYVRRKSQSLVQYIPEVSADKVAWNSGAAAVRENNVVSLDATFERVYCQDLTPISAGSPRFIRLRVVKP